MKFVLCHPGSKRPIGNAWQTHILSADEVAARLAADPSLNVGLVLGAVSGVIDVEIDSPEAAKGFKALFGDVHTPAWSSLRGAHYIFKADDRLAGLPAVVKVQGIEVRMGNGKAAQSICPPSIVDDFQRRWLVKPEECEPAKLPEAVVALLLSHAAVPTTDNSEDEMFGGLQRELQLAKVAELKAYFGRIGNPVKSEHRNHLGCIFLHLTFCPWKPSEHDDGDPCVIVKPDGTHTFKCQHAKCSERDFADVEEMYGPLHPVIKIGPDLERVVTEAIGALAANPKVYQRGGVLVEPVQDAPLPKLCLLDNGGTRFRTIPTPTLSAILSTAAVFKRFDTRAKEFVRCLPPEHVVSAVAASPTFPGIRVATGVVSCPALRRDGSIATAAGYDAATGLYCDLNGKYPALTPVADAKALLEDIVIDFPFASDAHRSGFFATLLTLLARPAFSGSSPFAWFDGSVSRIGKGLLTDLITMIVEGRRAARYAMPRGDDELRKLITSIAISGAPYLLFDNIKGKFGGHTLENALTTGRWSDRVLGVNKQVDLPLCLVWLGTSNNARLSADMVGRTIQIRLETDCENPGKRDGFRHPQLLDYVKQRRRELAMAALSIPVAYIEAGRPDQHLPAWGGFQEWSDLVRNSLVWAGWADPDTRATLAEEVDDDSALLRAVMEGWEELGFPATAATVLDVIRSTSEDKYPTLRAAIGELEGDPKKALAYLLRDSRGRVINGKKFIKTDHKTPKWQIVKVGEP